MHHAVEAEANPSQGANQGLDQNHPARKTRRKTEKKQTRIKPPLDENCGWVPVKWYPWIDLVNVLHAFSRQDSWTSAPLFQCDLLRYLTGPG